jgi:Uma2 family endonuclease
VEGTLEVALPLQQIRRLSVEEYHRMGELGILQPDERLELIDGVLQQMSPIGSQHAACVSKLMNLLLPPLQGRALVRVQNPIVLDDHTEPEPDVAIVRQREDDYSAAHPRSEDVLIVIEVADTTLEYDKRVKLSRYAQANIPEAWIVNLVERRVEIYQGVVLFNDRAAAAYRTRTNYYTDDVISFSEFPSLEIAVADILP